MTNDDFQLLVRAHSILARMPRQFSATKAAFAMERAVETKSADDARAVLLANGVLDVAAVLAGAAYTLRSTGHFESAQAMDAFATRIRDWERRDEPRHHHRSSGGFGAA